MDDPIPCSIDGFYEIGSIGNLFWFAEQVNAGNYALNARVINNFAGDVTFRNYQWVPIGGSSVDDTSVGYEGIFDGQGYTIALFPEDMLVEGDAVLGLFGTLKEGAVVKNLSISNRIDGYLTTKGTTYTYDGCRGVIAAGAIFTILAMCTCVVFKKKKDCFLIIIHPMGLS